MKRTLVSAAILVAVACSHQLDGPTPSISAVAPSTICVAQADTTVTISGSGFSPMVVDALTNSPSVVMPHVFLVAGDGTATEVPAAGVSMPDGTGTALTVVIPQGLVPPTSAAQPSATYDVRVVNPNGHEGTLADGLTVVPPPDIEAIDPTSGAVGTQVPVTITGNGFLPGMTIQLDATPALRATSVVVVSDTSATGTFDLTGVAPGVYGVTIENADGCSDTLPAAFTVYQPRDIAVLSIDPPFGCTCESTTVTITGDGGFVSTPRVTLGSTPSTSFERVAYLGFDATAAADTLTAVLPPGAPVGGPYDVTVLNPPSDGGVGVLRAAFRVVQMPIPRIEAVLPSRGDPIANTPVSIFGKNFRDQAKVELIDVTGTAVATVDNITPVSDSRIDVTLPTLGMIEGAYLVRVTDKDEMTYSTFSNFIVGAIGPSGNLHPFASLTQTLAAPGRRIVAGTSARDDLGNTYLYAIGGDTGDGMTALGTYEVSQLSKFGSIGAWRIGGTPLVHPRTGAAAVTVPVFDPQVSPFIPIQSYVFVVGGRDDTGSIRNDIERAQVLREVDAPRVAGTALAGGTLAAGTWYYKVSAVLASTDPDNPNGETLPSDEAIVTIGGANRSIQLSWDPVTSNGTAAVAYRIYRTDAVDGVSQTEHRIAEVSSTSYTDTGAAAGTVASLAAGSLGVWVVQTQTLGTPRWGTQAALIKDTTGARFVYVVGGKNDNAAGYLGSVEVAPVSSMGALTGGFTGTGTNAMSPRAFFSLVVETRENVSTYSGAGRMCSLGGVGAGGASGLFEISNAVDGGGNGAWTATGLSLGNRAGLMSVITGEKLFAVGGAGMATTTTFSTPLNTGRDVRFNADGTVGTPMQSTANALLTPRALGAAVAGSGFIYFIGGTSTGTDALTTVERTF